MHFSHSQATLPCVVFCCSHAIDTRSQVTLEELYKGNTRKLSLQRFVKCDSCKGIGSKSGRKYNCEVRTG